MNAEDSRLLVQQSLASFQLVQPVVASVERPRAVTVVCLLGFIQCALSAIGVLILAPDGLVLLIGLAMAGAQAACLSGLWRMRGWSLPAYFVLMAILHVLSFIGGSFSLLVLLLTIATLGVGLANIDDME